MPPGLKHLLGADEDVGGEEAAVLAAVGGFDGEGGLADAADAVEEHAPGAVFGAEGAHHLAHLLVAAEEGAAAGEVVGRPRRKLLHDFRLDRLACGLFAIFE